MKKYLLLAFFSLFLASCSSKEPKIVTYPFKCNGTDYSIGGLIGQKPASIYFDGDYLKISINADTGVYTEEFYLSKPTMGTLFANGSYYNISSTMIRSGDTLYTSSTTLDANGKEITGFGTPEAQDYSVSLNECIIRKRY